MAITTDLIKGGSDQAFPRSRKIHVTGSRPDIRASRMAVDGTCHAHGLVNAVRPALSERTNLVRR
jgi:hypothetical protein